MAPPLPPLLLPTRRGYCPLAFILNQLQEHVAGLCALQSSEGFWHQLLDRNDSYLETSATAIYCYSIAHAIRKGWLEGITYGGVAAYVGGLADNLMMRFVDLMMTIPSMLISL